MGHALPLPRRGLGLGRGGVGADDGHGLFDGHGVLDGPRAAVDALVLRAVDVLALRSVDVLALRRGAVALAVRGVEPGHAGGRVPVGLAEWLRWQALERQVVARRAAVRDLRDRGSGKARGEVGEGARGGGAGVGAHLVGHLVVCAKMR